MIDPALCNYSRCSRVSSVDVNFFSTIGVPVLTGGRRLLPSETWQGRAGGVTVTVKRAVGEIRPFRFRGGSSCMQLKRETKDVQRIKRRQLQDAAQSHRETH